MERFDVIVVGGCAAGLCCALQVARQYPTLRIAVLEQLPRTGKKILATGNGRCNLTNLYATEYPYHNKSFAHPALSLFPPEEVLMFFSSLHLLTYSDSEGRVYPRSNTAASVTDALRFAAKDLQVCVYTEQKVTEIHKKNGDFFINHSFCCKKLILATGGKASPSQGSDGSGFALAKMLGHSITRLYPALVPLKCNCAVLKSLKGIRAHNVTCTLMQNNRLLTKTKGEVLFTDFGLSGIAAMELAATAGQALAEESKNECLVHIDFLPEMQKAEMISYFKKLQAKSSSRDFESLLTGLLPKALGIALCSACGITLGNRSTHSLNNTEMKKLVEIIKDFPLIVTGTKGFDCAQVTRGGVCVSEINAATMESKLCPNLFFAGEIMDVDGGCGGFNLHWAWVSALTAGKLGEQQ